MMIPESTAKPCNTCFSYLMLHTTKFCPEWGLACVFSPQDKSGFVLYHALTTGVTVKTTQIKPVETNCPHSCPTTRFFLRLTVQEKVILDILISICWSSRPEPCIQHAGCKMYQIRSNLCAVWVAKHSTLQILE